MNKPILQVPVISKVFCIFLILLFLLFCGVSKEEKEVIECYKKYNTAILNDMGEEAIKCIDSKTVDYYQDILDKALYADKEAVRKENLTDRLMIFQIRHVIPLEELIKMNGTEFLIYSINKGWVGKPGVLGIKVKNVKIEGNFATADSYIFKKNTGIKYQFYSENNQWKFNVVSLMHYGSIYLKQQVKESGYSNEDDFLFYGVERWSEKKVTKDLYEPLIDKKE